MAESTNQKQENKSQPYAFKAETHQLLDILINSVYTEREIFLRELISNASDALTRVDFEILTNRDVLDPDAELAIRIIPNKEAQTLTIEDTGIGMTADELITNLGTIAQSGAREFISAFKENAQKADAQQKLTDLIGQFGVGFYSAFMVAEWIRVTSRSYQKEAQAATWFSTGDDTFTVEPAEREKRGTSIVIKLKEDAKEFLETERLREIIRRHSDFIPFPIYINDEKEQVNRQTALWRQQPRELKQEDYEAFYKQLTLDFEPPLTYTHMVVDAPVQMYALLFIPTSPEKGFLSSRKENGLKLYARKVLIDEYYKNLLPEYLAFVEGVVDSEDIPLNVSRESVQANRVIATLKKLITSKVLDMLKKLADDDKEKYDKFWQNYADYIKQGVAIEQKEPEALYPLLRFHTNKHPATLSSLDDYVSRMKPDQKEIYYIMGEDQTSVLYSPHLDIVNKYDYEVLLFTSPSDAFMLTRLHEYQDYKLANVAAAELELPEKEETPEEETKTEAKDYAALIDLFKKQLGEKVVDVRVSNRLSDSPARLVDPEGALPQELQKVYKLLDKDYEVSKKILEINPKHPILQALENQPETSALSPLIIEQIYEDALLIEGLHPDPASMINRIQKILEAALV